jgi:hypothetical protein
MDDNGVRNTLDSLLGADPDVMDRDELAGFVSQLGRVRGWCAAAEVRVSRRTRQLAAQGHSESAASLLSDSGRCSSKDAHTASERETICGVMPSFEDALAAGAVSAAHVDALAAATRNLNDQLLAEFAACEADLLADAGSQRVEVFERGCRDLARHLAAQASANSDVDELDQQRKNSTVRKWTNKLNGMHHTLLTLDPVRDAELWTAVNAKVASLRQSDGTNGTPFEQLQVEAFIATVTNSTPGDAVSRVPQVGVLIDYQTICDGLHANSICELENGTPIPVSTARRLCCDANVFPVVLGGNGEVLDVGQTVRTATPAQRKALRAMHRTCAHPGCRTIVDDCKMHHIDFFRNGGDTAVNNLLPLCEIHHHLVHEGGWRLTMTSGRVATWRRPDGTIWHTKPTIDRQPSRQTSRRPDPAEQHQPTLC